MFSYLIMFMNFDKYLPNYWKKIIAYSVLIEAGHLSLHLISSHLFWLNKIKFILLVLSKDRTTSHKVIKVHNLTYLQQMVDFDLTKRQGLLRNSKMEVRVASLSLLR